MRAYLGCLWFEITKLVLFSFHLFASKTPETPVLPVCQADSVIIKDILKMESIIGSRVVESILLKLLSNYFRDTAISSHWKLSSSTPTPTCPSLSSSSLRKSSRPRLNAILCTSFQESEGLVRDPSRVFLLHSGCAWWRKHDSLLQTRLSSFNSLQQLSHKF